MEAQCNVTWQAAKPALMQDLVQTGEGVLPGIWQQDQPAIQAEYVIPVGFLKKPYEGSKPKAFRNLKASFKKNIEKWTKEHPNIRRLLHNPKIRDLEEMMDFDYVTIPEDWANSLQIQVHECGEHIRFVSAAKKVEKEMVPKPEYDFSKDFDHLQECCMGPTGKLVKDSVPTSVFWRGDYATWPSNVRFTGPVPVGYNLATIEWDRKMLLAAAYKYSLSRNLRPFYLNTKIDSEQYFYTDGHFFLPGEFAIQPMKNYSLQALFHLHSEEMLEKWGDQLDFELQQHIIDCACEQSGTEAEDDRRKLSEDKPKIFVPRLIGVAIDPATKERDWEPPFDLIESYIVDFGYGWKNGKKHRDESLIAYDDRLMNELKYCTTTNKTMCPNKMIFGFSNF